MDIVALLASFGGNLGLFMGVNVLSFIILIYIFIYICYARFRKLAFL